MSLNGRRDGLTIHCRASRIGIIIFAIIWILIVSFAAYTVISNKIKISQNDYVLTKATVTECVSRETTKMDSDGDMYKETVYDITVVYYIDGEEYSKILYGYSKYYAEGEKIELYYNQDNPQDTVNNISNDSFGLFIIILGVFELIGVALLVYGIRGRRQHSEPDY